MTQAAYVAGVSMTPFGKRLGSVKSLAQAAVREALTDAGLELRDVNAAYFGNVTQGYYENIQYTRGQIVLRDMGYEGGAIVNVENACATGATAFAEAARAVRAGDVDVALAVAAERMTGFDPAVTLGFFDTGWDPEKVDDHLAQLQALGAGITPPPEFASTGPYSAMMEVYAAWARRHMQAFGTRIEHFAQAAAKNHDHAVHNPRAQFRTPMSTDQVLAGRKLAYPLTVPMCAPISDGAAAAIIVSETIARRVLSRAVRVRAAEVRASVNRDAADTGRHIGRLTAAAAYERAGLGPEDVSVAEVHDATAVGEVIHMENLGLCPMGEGGPFTASGATRIGGRLPVNPSGGLESKGHPIAATGLGQVFEIVTQLRGEAGQRQVEGAQIGITESSGGVWGIEEAASGVIILEGPAR
jgi:acetyl-CoA acyltransferase